jgi:hypothetical protein
MSEVQKPLLESPPSKEEWRSVEGFPDYEVSNLGRARHIVPITPFKDSEGYLSIRFYKNHKPTTKKLHRFIALAFIPNPNNLPQVNHKDRNRANPCVTNLEWVTHQGNSDHAWANPNRITRQKRGEAHGNSKFTPHQVICIRAFAFLWRQRSMARKFCNVTQHAIAMVMTREVWNHVPKQESDSSNFQHLWRTR